MTKICSVENCNNPVWGGGYCKYHQGLRSDKKKPSVKRSPIRKVTPATENKNRRIVIKLQRLCSKIWNKRKHVCCYCGTVLSDEPKTYMFDHVLEKSSYPSLMFEEDNIVLTCFDCHQIKTSKKYTSIMKFVILSTVGKFIKEQKLITVGNPNISRLKDWIAEPKTI